MAEVLSVGFLWATSPRTRTYGDFVGTRPCRKRRSRKAPSEYAMAACRSREAAPAAHRPAAAGPSAPGGRHGGCHREQPRAGLLPWQEHAERRLFLLTRMARWTVEMRTDRPLRRRSLSAPRPADLEETVPQETALADNPLSLSPQVKRNLPAPRIQCPRNRHLISRACFFRRRSAATVTNPSVSCLRYKLRVH